MPTQCFAVPGPSVIDLIWRGEKRLAFAGRRLSSCDGRSNDPSLLSGSYRSGQPGNGDDPQPGAE